MVISFRYGFLSENLSVVSKRLLFKKNLLTEDRQPITDNQ